MTRAVLGAVCAFLLAGPAAAQNMTGASHRLRGAHVSAGFAVVTAGAKTTRVSLGDSDPPGFSASLAASRASALGILATLAGGFPIDPDGDGVVTFLDNCPFHADTLQLDFDGDRVGDVCDPDDENDSLLDAEEMDAGTNPFAADTDGDGVTDFAELIARGSNPLTTDTDGDGWPDTTDNCVSVANNSFIGSGDGDGDGLGDARDVDARG